MRQADDGSRRRALPLVLVALVVTSAGGCLRAVVTDGAGSGSHPAPTHADEIEELKARIARLEQRQEPASKAPAGSAERDTAPAPTSPGAAEGTAGATPSPRLRAEWKNGLQIANEDDSFRVHVGGRAQFDVGWNGAGDAVQFGPGGIGNLEDGALFRRASLRVDGTIYRQINWLAEYDFANNVDNDSGPGVQPIGTPGFSEVSVTVTELPVVGNFRVGFIDEPLGFARLTSSRWLNFMERAPGVNSFTATSPGAMLFNWTEDERATWAVGIFHPTNNSFGFGVGDGELAATGRLTWLPWYEDDGRRLVHLGLGATHRRPTGGMIELRGRPSVRTMPSTLEPALADTGDLLAGSQEVFDAELAAVCGPWTLQSEYYATFLHDAAPDVAAPAPGAGRGTLFYQGAYVEVLYFLTGEYRAFNRREGVFDRVVPRENFRLTREGAGWGAWQVGVRYAYLDLQNRGLNGATLNDVTFGLNWFFNPNTKVQWNYALDHRTSTPSGSSGQTSIFGMRVALDF